MGQILGAYSREAVCLAASKYVTNAILFFYLLLDMLKTDGRYVRIIAFEAVSMDLSPECDMNSKG